MTSRVLIVALLSVFTLQASTADAAVSSVSGTVQLTASPYPAETDNVIFVFDEQSAVPFVSAQSLDFGSISAGTLVNSHYLQFDPVIPNGSVGTGSVTFDGPIIGVITSTTGLTRDLGGVGTADEYFGLELTLGAYPMGIPSAVRHRGLGSALDSLSFTLGDPTLTINSLEIQISGAIDAIRVLTAPASLTGDLDGDGFVGINDLNIVLANWNQTVPPGDPLADPSGDNFVGIDDLNEVLGNWNAGTPPDAAATIPEPGSVIVVVLGTLTVLRRR